jgi:hypothetical protein
LYYSRIRDNTIYAAAIVVTITEFPNICSYYLDCNLEPQDLKIILLSVKDFELCISQQLFHVGVIDLFSELAR